MVDKEKDDNTSTTKNTAEYLAHKVTKLNAAVEEESKMRHESEEQIVQLLKEMMTKIKEQIKGE